MSQNCYKNSNFPFFFIMFYGGNYVFVTTFKKITWWTSVNHAYHATLAPYCRVIGTSRHVGNLFCKSKTDPPHLASRYPFVAGDAFHGISQPIAWRLNAIIDVHQSSSILAINSPSMRRRSAGVSFFSSQGAGRPLLSHTFHSISPSGGAQLSGWP